MAKRKNNKNNGSGADKPSSKKATNKTTQTNNSYHRKRSKQGWAYTKEYPHQRHPANYRNLGDDDIEYLTFTHSKQIELTDGTKIQTVPMGDNISPKERATNKPLSRDEQKRSYAYPKVFQGKRSALGKKTDEFEPIDFDKNRISVMFVFFKREKVPKTGGEGQFKKQNKNKPDDK